MIIQIIQNIADELDAPYYEVSALTGKGVEELFKDVAVKLLRKY